MGMWNEFFGFRDGSPHFLNVDLEVTSKQRLDELVRHFERRGIVLRNAFDDGLHSASFELDGCFQEPEGLALALLDEVEALEETAQQQFRTAERRVLSIGFTSGLRNPHVEHRLSAETLHRAAAWDCHLSIVVYRAPRADWTMHL